MKLSKKCGKAIAVLGAVCLMSSAFAGCGKDAKKETASNGADSFSFWGVLDANIPGSVKDYGDLMLYKEMEKATGIKIDFIHPISGSTGSEAFLTMISGGDLPDIMEYNWSTYNGGAQAAIDDGLIVELNDYLEEYAPNYYDYMEGEKGKANNYLYKYQATTAEGNYYGFNRLNIGTAREFNTFYVRADLLKKWGMEVPVTIDDWTALFAKAKSEGIETPFTASNCITNNKYRSISFHNGFNACSGFYLDDKGKVKFGPFDPEYKEYLAQMAQWVKLGYIDTGFVTNDNDTVVGKMANGKAIASIGGIGGSVGKVMPAGLSVNPEFDLVGCPYPVKKAGDTAIYLGATGEATGTANAISTQCANVEKAVEWCDFVYSEEGFLLQTFGIEGDTYTVEEKDGEKHYVYTDKITNPEVSGYSSVTEALYAYMLPANHPGLDQHPDYLDGYYPYQCQKDALKTINKDMDEVKKHLVPELNYTEEETERKTDIEMLAYDAFEVAVTNIVLGKASIDTYDKAVEALKADGYDELIKIMQTAYDRYMAKF